ncbi:MAG: hypothetical protein RMJ14_01825 [Nitrososphaerota archaeon]|nr:hypothetical protein [Aigarchaeota archaeon]MDW8076362.1 hypothetical protein [Nitrososphaerota archaeon]
MSTIEKFNIVEGKLVEIAKSVKGVQSVSVAEHPSISTFPRIYVWVRRGRSQDLRVSGTKRQHRWTFEYVIETLSGEPGRSYEEAKRIHWAIYDAIMADRTLGIKEFTVFAYPSVEFERVEGRTGAGDYGHVWIHRVEVELEA